MVKPLLQSTDMLVSYLKINSEFFADPPPRRKWRSWVEDGLVDGKVIDNQIYINRNHFASNSIFGIKRKQTAVDILMQSA